MKRRDAFIGLIKHPFYGKDFKRLKLEELATCLLFISERTALGHLEFEAQIQRWNMDDASKRGPRHALMSDLLIAANNQAFQN